MNIKKMILGIVLVIGASPLVMGFYVTPKKKARAEKAVELSIQDLLDQGQINIKDGFLNLREISLASLVGLENIPNKEQIRSIDLSFNYNFKEIPEGIFKGFKNVKWLDLSHNDIKKIDIDTFDGLESLEELDISQNPIEDYEALSHLKLKSLKILSPSWSCQPKG